MPDPKDGVEFLRTVEEAESTNRIMALEDLKFRWGEQWPAYAKQSRGDERPQLTINETDAYIRKVENNQRQQKPRIRVHPVDSIADPKIAKVITGLNRHIWVNSDADNAVDLASSYQMTIGFGYWRIDTDYVREDSFYQDIFINGIENPFTVYFDHFSKFPDGSDAEKCLITDMERKESFLKAHPGANTAGFTDRGSGDYADWITNDEIRLAEYFYVERTKAKLVMLSDGTILWADQMPPAEMLRGAGIGVKGDRDSFKRVVKWCKQTAFEILEEKTLPGRWIPVVPVYGMQAVIDGKRERMGLVRFAKDPARMINFWHTAYTESIALAPKAKWLVQEGATEGHENEWNQANISPRPLLTYKMTGPDDRPLTAPPERLQPEPPPQGVLEALMLSSQSLQKVMGIYEPAVRQGAQHKSDKTLNAERNEAENSNFHFYDNLTRSIKHTGRIILDLIPKIYDTQRVMRIIGEDGQPDLVTINEKRMDESGAIQKVLNDVTIGTYDVVMETGPGYDTKRQEAVALMTEMLGTPLGEKIAAVADDVIVRNMDGPGFDLIADRLAAANPLAQIDDKSDVPPQVQMIVKSLQAKLQQAQQTIQSMALELKFRTNIENIKQEGATRRELMKQESDAHEREITQAQKQHDTETYAVTAQNVAEINGLVRILTSNSEHAHKLREMLATFEHEVTLKDMEQTAKANETEAVQ